MDFETNPVGIEELDELQQELRANVGQLVLAVYRWENSSRGPGGCWAPDNYYHREVTRMVGIIADDGGSFKVTRKTAELPTSRYVEEDCYSGLSVGRRELSDGLWQCQHGLLPISEALGTVIRYSDGWHRQYHPEDPLLEIVIGDDRVVEWFGQGEEHRGIRRMEYPEKDPLWLQQAAELLGRPLAEAPELEEHKERERQAVLELLWQINRCIEQPHRELMSLRKAKETTGTYVRDGAVGLVEDEDDLRVLSFGPREALRKGLDEMTRAIERAGQLGLGDHPYTIAFKERYGL